MNEEKPAISLSSGDMRYDRTGITLTAKRAMVEFGCSRKHIKQFVDEIWDTDIKDFLSVIKKYVDLI